MWSEGRECRQRLTTYLRPVTNWDVHGLLCLVEFHFNQVLTVAKRKGYGKVGPEANTHLGAFWDWLSQARLSKLPLDSVYNPCYSEYSQV